ncbi:hypothetical protein ABPG72_017725 [Tetrahymena utriculariae]
MNNNKIIELFQINFNQILCFKQYFYLDSYQTHQIKIQQYYLIDAKKINKTQIHIRKQSKTEEKNKIQKNHPNTREKLKKYTPSGKKNSYIQSSNIISHNKPKVTVPEDFWAPETIRINQYQASTSNVEDFQ